MALILNGNFFACYIQCMPKSFQNFSHIDYVDSRLSPEELKSYEMSENEHKVEIDGDNFSIFITDFRRVNENGEKSNVFPIEVYFMGFMETDPVKPNELSAAIVERTKEKGGVLIVPRFENLPSKPESSNEATLALKGLSKMEKYLKEQNLDFDFSNHDVEIIGFSDGARSSLEFAGLIDKIPQKSGCQRILHQISPTATIDLVNIPENADGNEMIRGFSKQVTWIVFEESRLRINNVIEKEQRELTNNIYAKMASGEIYQNENEMDIIVNNETSQKDENGNHRYPLLVQKFKKIGEPLSAYDTGTIKEVVTSLARLVSSKEGRDLFVEQFKESLAINIPFLTDVIIRALAANPGYKPEDIMSGKVVAHALNAIPGLKEHMLANEIRSPVCNQLTTFDLDMQFPIEDIVFPAEAYGRTLRKQFSESTGTLEVTAPRTIMEQVEHALKNNDDEMLGVLCYQHPDLFKRVLFPHAKSVELKFTGKQGGLSSTHLAPLKHPEEFFK